MFYCNNTKICKQETTTTNKKYVVTTITAVGKVRDDELDAEEIPRLSWQALSIGVRVLVHSTKSKIFHVEAKDLLFSLLSSHNRRQPIPIRKPFAAGSSR